MGHYYKHTVLSESPHPPFIALNRRVVGVFPLSDDDGNCRARLEASPFPIIRLITGTVSLFRFESEAPGAALLHFQPY